MITYSCSNLDLSILVKVVPKHYAGIPKQVYYVSVLKYVPTGAYCSLIRGFCWTCSNPDGWFFHVNRRLSSPYHGPWLDGLRWPRGHRTTQWECFGFYWKPRIVIMSTLSSLVVPGVFVVTSSSAISDDRVDIMATVGFQYQCITAVVCNNGFYKYKF